MSLREVVVWRRWRDGGEAGAHEGGRSEGEFCDRVERARKEGKRRKSAGFP